MHFEFGLHFFFNNASQDVVSLLGQLVALNVAVELVLAKLLLLDLFGDMVAPF